jgi:hypothetical protein
MELFACAWWWGQRKVFCKLSVINEEVANGGEFFKGDSDLVTYEGK